MDEPYHVLWAYRTTQILPIGEIPFSLIFEMEAVNSIELKLPSTRVVAFNKQHNPQDLRVNLDLLEEKREEAQVRMAAYRRKVARYYNSRVRSKTLRVRDLVLQRVTVSQPQSQKKLAPNWIGPYEVVEVVWPETYRLKKLEGIILPRSWNSENLRMYYQ